MDPVTSRILWLIFGRSMADFLMAQGKVEEAQLFGAVLAAVRAKRDINTELLALAEKWAETGEPPLEDIIAARQAIQALL
jgi:hypothetical protein